MVHDLLHQHARARVLVSLLRRAVFLTEQRLRGVPPEAWSLPRVPGRLRRFPSESHGRFTLPSVRSLARVSALRPWLSPSVSRCLSPSTGAGAQVFSRATTTSADFPLRAHARRPFRHEAGSPRVRDAGLPSAAARSTSGPCDLGGFAFHRSLAQVSLASHRVSVRRLAGALRASFRRSVASPPLPFAWIVEVHPFPGTCTPKPAPMSGARSASPGAARLHQKCLKHRPFRRCTEATRREPGDPFTCPG